MKLQFITTRKSFEFHVWNAEFLFLCFLLLLSFLEAAFGREIPEAQSMAVRNVVIAGAILLGTAALRRIRRVPLRMICRFAGIGVLMSLVYHQMGRIIHIFMPSTYDLAIDAAEVGLFGAHPTAWFEQFASPWLTETMMFAYVIYVPALLLVGIFFVLRGRSEEAERYSVDVTLTSLACYIFYILLPVAGPSRALAPLRTVPMEGYFFTSLAQYMIANVHLPGGAFPSAHCAATTVMLVALYRSKKAFGYCFLPLALLIFVSTVYGWFHYVTDVAAGIALAGIVMAVAPRVQALLTSGTLRLRLPELRYVAAEESAP